MSARPTPWWERVLRQLRSPIIYILLFALAFDGLIWVIEGTPGSTPVEHSTWGEIKSLYR